ncbi:MAG: hypothetical protein ACM31L_13615, partial [Actinomycetota bacterium]
MKNVLNAGVALAIFSAISVSGAPAAAKDDQPARQTTSTTGANPSGGPVKLENGPAIGTGEQGKLAGDGPGKVGNGELKKLGGDDDGRPKQTTTGTGGNPSGGPVK